LQQPIFCRNSAFCNSAIAFGFLLLSFVLTVLLQKRKSKLSQEVRQTTVDKSLLFATSEKISEVSEAANCFRLTELCSMPWHI